EAAVDDGLAQPVEREADEPGGQDQGHRPRRDHEQGEERAPAVAGQVAQGDDRELQTASPTIPSTRRIVRGARATIAGSWVAKRNVVPRSAFIRARRSTMAAAVRESRFA